MVTVYEQKNTKEASSKLNNSKLSEPINEFLSSLESERIKSHSSSDSTISVTEYLGGVSRLYEKVRTTVEYKGEHVLRRNAIERMLKRLLWSQGVLQTNVDTKQVAEQLIRELIWARYVANNHVPRSVAKKVETTIQKYVDITKLLDNSKSKVSKTARETWLIGVISSEIEDTLDPTYRELYVHLFYRWFRERFVWKGSGLSTHEKALQIYLAVHKAYQHSDDAIMRYHLLLLEFPKWQDAKEPDLSEFVEGFPKLYAEIEEHLHFESALSIYRTVKRHVPAFEVLQMVATKYPKDLERIMLDPEKLEEVVREECQETYSQTSGRVTRGIIRSVIYIFITKVFLALLIEIPYEAFRYEEIRMIPITINIIVPPFLMALIGASISVPGDKNTDALITKVKQIVYAEKVENKIAFQVSKSRNSWTTFFSVFYVLLALMLFSAIAMILIKLQFTFIGIGIFFAFLSLVLLFAYRVKANASKLRVEAERETFLDSLVNFITLPFLSMGMYLSKGLSFINIASVILDFLIEAPLKSIIEVIEGWISFVKEKREEVINVPD